MLTQIVAYFIVTQKLAQLEVKRDIAKKNTLYAWSIFFGKFLWGRNASGMKN